MLENEQWNQHFKNDQHSIRKKTRKKLYVACQCNMLDYAKNKLIIKDRSTKDINMIILFI